MGGKEGIERGPLCPLSCWEHLPLTRPCTSLLGGEMAPCWVSTGSLEAGRWQRCPRPPGTPHPPEPQPCCTQTRGDVALHSHGGTQASKHWGRGYPQAGHPGHLPGCACAPAARLRPLTSRLCSAVPGKADYAPALQLSFSPASPPASLRCLARPGGTGGLLGRVWGSSLW